VFFTQTKINLIRDSVDSAFPEESEGTSSNSLTLQKLVTSSSHSQIFEALFDQCPVIAKIMKKHDRRAIATIESEFLKHPNLVEIIEIVEFDDLHIAVIMEKCEWISPESTEDLILLTRHMTAALEFIHSHDMVHRQINTRHVFLGKDGNWKLGDLSKARKLTAIGDVSFLSSVAGDSDFVSDWNQLVWTVAMLVMDGLEYPKDVNRSSLLNFLPIEKIPEEEIRRLLLDIRNSKCLSPGPSRLPSPKIAPLDFTRLSMVRESMMLDSPKPFSQSVSQPMSPAVQNNRNFSYRAPEIEKILFAKLWDIGLLPCIQFDVGNLRVQINETSVSKEVFVSENLPLEISSSIFKPLFSVKSHWILINGEKKFLVSKLSVENPDFYSIYLIVQLEIENLIIETILNQPDITGNPCCLVPTDDGQKKVKAAVTYEKHLNGCFVCSFPDNYYEISKFLVNCDRLIIVTGKDNHIKELSVAEFEKGTYSDELGILYTIWGAVFQEFASLLRSKDERENERINLTSITKLGG
jgi:serine/threonine protein kinase